MEIFIHIWILTIPALGHAVYYKLYQDSLVPSQGMPVLLLGKGNFNTHEQHAHKSFLLTR